MLLANKGDVTARDDDGMTPLHWAACCGRKDMAELLLANKAEVNAKNAHNETPLHKAAINGRKDMVELLRQHGGHD